MMVQKKLFKIALIIIVGFLVNTNPASAQLKKANSHFNKKDYKEAVVYYLKVLRKDSTNEEAIKNIAFSYRKLKDSENAEIYFEKAIKLDSNDNTNRFYYGQALKTNGKIKKAQHQFEKFSVKNPTSLIGKLMVQSCVDVLNWEVQEKRYEVSIIENINSEDADFCPFSFNDNLVFVSDRKTNLINEYDPESLDQSYLSIFYAKKGNNFKNPKTFSNQLNSTYHDGPISITQDNKTIYFTRSDKKEHGKNYINKPQIFIASLNGNKWKNITPFVHNNSNYSVAHPSISEDGQQLFFSSDMPGGYGGMDLYVCHKDSGKWSSPINLGKNVNSSENEIFPYYKNKTLYFSSNGHSGYGGLDLYFVTLDKVNKWQNPVNLKAPINSPKDDFGIFYLDNGDGYLSSNRDGGLGKDDIYYFTKLEFQETTSITGLLEHPLVHSHEIKLNLLNENNHVVESVIVDDKGRFKFNDLHLSENYLLEINEEDDGQFIQNSKLYITNSKGEKVLLLNKNKNEKYAFQSIPYEDYNQLEILDEVDQDGEDLFTIDLSGQVYEKIPGDFNKEIEVWMIDDDGNIIEKTTSDSNGKFLFEKLSPDKQYLFMLPENDSDLKIAIVDEDGKLIESATKLANGRYQYVRLNTDQKVIALINEVDEVIEISEDENFILSKILYNYRSSEVNQSAAKELDKLILILNKNKNIGIEISSYTDSKGSKEFNMRLSQERADKVFNYIVVKGKVPRAKVKAKGYGETRPIAPNNLPNGKDNPEGRRKNRRTEVNLIEIGN